ncbi:hypothetical protein NQZ68_024343 [Dissostichus eleginoides]|nr:hypothetical protein NQZ68_024343 [Dissostichus eleginoides]
MSLVPFLWAIYLYNPSYYSPPPSDEQPEDFSSALRRRLQGAAPQLQPHPSERRGRVSACQPQTWEQFTHCEATLTRTIDSLLVYNRHELLKIKENVGFFGQGGHTNSPPPFYRMYLHTYCGAGPRYTGDADAEAHVVAG